MERGRMEDSPPSRRRHNDTPPRKRRDDTPPRRDSPSPPPKRRRDDEDEGVSRKGRGRFTAEEEPKKKVEGRLAKSKWAQND
jgi:hypothetical protein